MEFSDDDPDTDGEELPNAVGYNLLHVCSGIDRPGSYSSWVEQLGGQCLNYDIKVDPARDLCDDVAWEQLSGAVDQHKFHGMQADPVCTTFSAVRGLGGGPKPLRGHQGRDLYGLPDLDQDQTLQVAKDTLIAIRVARLAAAFAEQGWPSLIEQFVRREGQPHMFNMPELLQLRRIPGVRLRTFLQCPFGARTMKPTVMMYMAARMP